MSFSTWETPVPKSRRTELQRYLHGRCVHIKLPEDGKGLLKELVADGNVGNIRSVVVVQAVDVFHDAGAVGLDGRQDEEVLQVPEKKKEESQARNSVPPPT